MPNSPPSQKPLIRNPRAAPSLAVLLVMVGVLLLFNFANWRYLGVLKQQMQDDLVARLKSVATTTGLGLAYPDPPAVLAQVAELGADEETGYLEESFGGSAEHLALVDRLGAIQRANGLSRIVLMTPSGTVVADSTERKSPGERYEFLELDDREIRAAAAGSARETQLYWINDIPHMRLYAPLRGGNRLYGLVQVSVSPEFQDRVDALQAMVMRRWALNSLLLLVLGVSLWRMFRYLVRVEKSAMQGARIDAMGALAGNVAHELRNPLQIIRALSEEIAAETEPDSVPAQNARDIVGEVERLNEMVGNFLSLSRPPGEADLRVIPLGEEVEKVLSLLRKGQSPGVVFISEVGETEVRVKADERAVRQVLLNLLLNAREAVEHHPEAARRRGEVRVTLKERRGQAEIRIADNGPGFERKTAARAFEPFFTTKPMGTGLGLAISRGIIENLGGRITLHSPPGRGAEVVVTLPAVAPGTE